MSESKIMQLNTKKNRGRLTPCQSFTESMPNMPQASGTSVFDNVRSEDCLEVARCLFAYLSQYFDQGQGRDFVDRPSGTSYWKKPMEVVDAQDALDSLRIFLSKNAAKPSSVKWHELWMIMQSHNLSEHVAFQSQSLRGTKKIILDVSVDDAKLTEDAMFIRRSQIFHNLAYQDGRQ
jgi:hypothetical protein